MNTGDSGENEEFLQGVKRVTADNWKVPDLSHSFNISSEEWLKMVLEPRLKRRVPGEVQRLFEVARGTMAYGWYFNPLIALSLDQLYRLLETAVRIRCVELRISPNFTGSTGRDRKRKIEELTEELVRHRGMTKAQEVALLGIRNLRNGVCKPGNAQIPRPEEAEQWVRTSCEVLNGVWM